MVQVIKPPGALEGIASDRTVFLAGSIDMGLASDWQSEIIECLRGEDLVVFNPRRDAWDASWEQSIENPQFREQVEWELAALEKSSVIAMYFAPATKAPITLLELGLFARTGKVVVCCPNGFWRKGNVQVVCNAYQVLLVESVGDLVREIRSRILR